MMNVQEFVNELTKYRKLVEELASLEGEYNHHYLREHRDEIFNQAVGIVTAYSDLLKEVQVLKSVIAMSNEVGCNA